MNQLQENGAAAVLSSSSSSSSAIGNTVAATRGAGTSGVPTPQQPNKANEFLGVAKSIQQTGDVPPPRFGHTCTCVGNHKVVVFGGAVGCKQGNDICIPLDFYLLSTSLCFLRRSSALRRDSASRTGLLAPTFVVSHQ